MADLASLLEASSSGAGRGHRRGRRPVACGGAYGWIADPPGDVRALQLSAGQVRSREAHAPKTSLTKVGAAQVGVVETDALQVTTAKVSACSGGAGKGLPGQVKSDEGRALKLRALEIAVPYVVRGHLLTTQVQDSLCRRGRRGRRRIGARPAHCSVQMISLRPSDSE